MSEEEFEERQLTKLISDLRDINSYTDFKNGAFIYDLGHYQGLLLVNEIERLNKEKDYLDDYNRHLHNENERLNNIIEELEKWLEERKTYYCEGCSHSYEDSLGKTRLVNEDIFNEINVIKNKLKELKEGE